MKICRTRITRFRGKNELRSIGERLVTVAMETEVKHCSSNFVNTFSRHFRVICCIPHAAECKGTSSEDLSDADIESDVAAAVIVHGQSLEVFRSIYHSE